MMVKWKTAHIGEDGSGNEVWYMEVDEADIRVKKDAELLTHALEDLDKANKHIKEKEKTIRKLKEMLVRETEQNIWRKSFGKGVLIPTSVAEDMARAKIENKLEERK